METETLALFPAEALILRLAYSRMKETLMAVVPQEGDVDLINAFSDILTRLRIASPAIFEQVFEQDPVEAYTVYYDELVVVDHTQEKPAG